MLSAFADDQLAEYTKDVEYIVRGTLTIAVCQLPNGHQLVSLTGATHEADPEWGKRVALAKLKEQVWVYLGTELRHRTTKEVVESIQQDGGTDERVVQGS